MLIVGVACPGTTGIRVPAEVSSSDSMFIVLVVPFSLIHHQGAICCVACDRSSLRRITYTPQSSLLGAWFIVVKYFLNNFYYSLSECHLARSWYLRVLIGSDLASLGLRDDRELLCLR